MRVTALAVVLWMAVAPAAAAAAQRQATPAEEVEALQQMAAAIPLGSRVRVQVRGQRRMTATLMAVTADAVVVKREARVPEPAVTIRFEEIARLQRDEGRGVSIARAIGVGVAAGAGAILTMIAIAMSLD